MWIFICSKEKYKGRIDMTGVSVTNDGSITISFPDGNAASLPQASAWGVGPSFASWHEYHADDYVGRVSDVTVSDVWNNLLKSPAPGILLGGGLAQTGSITDTEFPGSVQHVVYEDGHIVINITLQDNPDDYAQHLLYPGAVVRHVTVRDGWVVIESVGIGNSHKMGPLSAQLNKIMGQILFSSHYWPGKSSPTDLSGLHCFPQNTSILLASNTSAAISTLFPGTTILAFDPAADSGRGALVPKRVTRLFRNVTTEWIELDLGETDPLTGGRKVLTVTPGHHFLDAYGNFPTISEMLLRGGGRARIVLADGSLCDVTGKRIVWCEANAHLYGGRAKVAAGSSGALAFAETEIDGWQTYNFEVEHFHTYVADGVCVHNISYGWVLDDFLRSIAAFHAVTVAHIKLDYAIRIGRAAESVEDYCGAHMMDNGSTDYEPVIELQIKNTQSILIMVN
jgi:hypothetical protein